MPFNAVSFLRGVRSELPRLIVATAVVVVASIACAQSSGPSPYSETMLYGFQGGNDGAYPTASLILDSSGALYGTTSDGGSMGYGTVFKLTPPASGQTQWTETVLYSFQGGNDGAYPSGRLILDTFGALFGATSYGGSTGNGYGAVFKLTPPTIGQTQWTETVLYRFRGGNDGAFPQGGLIFDTQGALYGTTASTVFKLTPPLPSATQWTETVLHRFQGGGDGVEPLAGLIFDTQGALYGTTSYGGSVGCYNNIGCGTVFKLTPPTIGQTQWTETVLYNFQGGNDSQHPRGGLIFDTQGALYGTTFGFIGEGQIRGNAVVNAVTSDYGAVFKLTPPIPPATQWTSTTLHSFQIYDGFRPIGDLIFDSYGALYGTTYEGGASANSGTVFKLTPPIPPATQWTETVLYNFQGGNDGIQPYAGLIFDTHGALFGTTTGGGGSKYSGTVFKLQCNGVREIFGGTVHQFCPGG